MLDVETTFHLNCINCDCVEFDLKDDPTKITCVYSHHASKHVIRDSGCASCLKSLFSRFKVSIYVTNILTFLTLKKIVKNEDKIKLVF